MTDPIHQPEPMHPEARLWHERYEAERAARLSLRDAIEAEVALLRGAAKETKSGLQATEFKATAAMLERILYRWVEGGTIEIAIDPEDGRNFFKQT